MNNLLAHFAQLRLLQKLKKISVYFKYHPKILKVKTNEKAKTLVSEIDEDSSIIFDKKLKHLDFISQFEMYLDGKNSSSFSVEFLQEFEKIKLETQRTTLEMVNVLNHKNLRVA